MSAIEETLAEREKRYGSFATHAAITQGIKRAMQEAPKWKALDASAKEALEMIAHKIGRILNGDPKYADNWHDLAGYATLIDQELAKVPPCARS